MHILALILDVVLAGYVTWEAVQFVPRYRQLKQDIAHGDAGARIRVYHNALVLNGSVLCLRWRRSDLTGIF